MTTNLKLTIFVLLILCFGAALVNAQKTTKPKTITPKTPDYKISNLKIVPFDSYKGEFEEAIKPDDTERSFFNDYSISLLVMVEVSIEKGGYEFGRTVQITVMEGKKIKKTKTEQMPPVEDNGKYYVPLWLDAGMCDTVKISAKITGQKTASTMTRSVLFQCGE
jgi:hypothetical protein